MTGMLAATSRGSWTPLYPLVQSKLFLVFKETRNETKIKKPLHVPIIKKLLEKPSKIKPTKILQVFCVAVEYYGFFCKLTWVTAVAVCENISVFTVQTPSKPRVWSLAVSLLLPEIWSQVSVLVFFLPSFPVPPTRVEAITCLMILSLEDGEEGYSRLWFVILHHWLPFLNLQSLTWILPPCTLRIEALSAMGEVRSKYFGFSTQCIVELSQKPKAHSTFLWKNGALNAPCPGKQVRAYVLVLPNP